MSEGRLCLVCGKRIGSHLSKNTKVHPGECKKLRQQWHWRNKDKKVRDGQKLKKKTRALDNESYFMEMCAFPSYTKEGAEEWLKSYEAISIPKDKSGDDGYELLQQVYQSDPESEQYLVHDGGVQPRPKRASRRNNKRSAKEIQRGGEALRD